MVTITMTVKTMEGLDAPRSSNHPSIQIQPLEQATFHQVTQNFNGRTPE
jgi:hypothetical protein